MKLSSILCPVDLVEDISVDYASRLARETGAVLHFLYAEETYIPHGIGLFGQLPVPLDADLAAYRALCPTVEEVEFEKHVAYGFAGEEIVSFATSNGIDVIVMGTHGRGGASRVLLGSVAEHVIRQAPCAVVTVKTPQNATETGDAKARQIASQ